MAAFLHLLVVIGSTTNQEVFFLRHGPATIGALLQRVPPTHHHTIATHTPSHYHHPLTITTHTPSHYRHPHYHHHTITTHTPSHYHHLHYHHPHTITLSPPTLSPPTHHHTITTHTITTITTHTPPHYHYHHHTITTHTLSPSPHYHHHHTYRIENIGNQPIQTLYRRQESAEQRYH